METRKKKSFKRLFAFLMAFVMVASLAVSAVFAAEPTFKDVPKDHDFYKEIEDLAAKKIVSGYGDTGLFKPEANLTRAQAAKMIAGAAGYKVSPWFKTGFTDVDKTVDMYEHIWALEEAKIVKGFGTTKEYRPEAEITRGHVAKMVALAFDLDMGDVAYDFSDLPADAEVADAIKVLASNGIVSGFGSTGLFKPDELVTRGQFAKMVSRAMAIVEAELEIRSAKAITETIDAKADQQLEFTINGAKKAADIATLLKAGFEVKFEASIAAVDPDTGKIATELAAGTKFDYRVVISHDDWEDDLVSNLQEVTVLNYAATVLEITKVEISSGDVVIESGKIVLDPDDISKVTKVMGVKMDDPDEEVDLSSLVEYKSSNNLIALVSSDGTFTPLKLGKFNLTVSAGDAKKVVSLEVVKDKRKASSLAVDKNDLKMAQNGADVTVKAVARDQYGDLFESFVIADSNVLTTGDAPIIVATLTGGTTDNKGEVSLTFKSIAVGAAVIKIRDFADKVDLASIKVTVAEGVLGYRKLEIVEEDKFSDDYVLDAYDAEDNSLKVVWNKYTADGFFIGAETDIATTGKTYTVSSSKDVATVAVTDGVITVTGVSEGKATISIKENTVTRASFEVTVVDSTPVVTYVEYFANAKLTDASGIEITKVIKHIKDENGKELVWGSDNTIKVGTTEVGSIEVKSTDFASCTISGNKITPGSASGKGVIVVRVLSGDDVVKDFELPVDLD